MRPNILAESHWKNIKGQKINLPILPRAATEAHNYHLPYGTNIFETGYLAQLFLDIARRIRNTFMSNLQLRIYSSRTNTIKHKLQ